MLRHLCLIAAAACVLGACSTPQISPGFILRTDLATTDCQGKPAKDIGATPSGPLDEADAPAKDIGATPSEPRDEADALNFLNDGARVADTAVTAPDCRGRGQPLARANGLRLQRGDVLSLATGVVGPFYESIDDGGAQKRAHFPASAHAPLHITLRSIDTASGRLYPDEDAFLAAALSMAGRHQDQKKTAGLAAALHRRQNLLWNTLMDNLRVWRRPVAQDVTEYGATLTERPSLILLVDHNKWCEALRNGLADSAAQADGAELAAFFSGTDAPCKSHKAAVEFGTVTNYARSAVQAIAVGPKPSGAYFATPAMAVYTQFGVSLKGARMGSGSASGSAAWTLADWQASQICRSREGSDLAIEALRLHDGSWVQIQSPADAGATFAVELVFTQSLQERRFVPTVHWSQRWKRVIAPADLDKLYARDVRQVHWKGVPAAPSMCSIQPAGAMAP